MIPNSEPPTLPNQKDFSTEFNDFLKICLMKNPEQRPSATDLLKHPFIVKAKSKAIIAQLVGECMTEIDEYRAQEQQEQQEQAAQQQQQGGNQGTMFNTIGTSRFDTTSGTMINHSTMSTNFSQGTMINAGTMVHHPGVGDGHGTTVFNNFVDDDGTGTMVVNNSARKDADPSLQQRKSNYPEPSYMKHLREINSSASSSNASTITQQPKSTNTMINPQDTSTVVGSLNLGKMSISDSSSSSSSTSSASHLRDLYRTGKSLEVVVNNNSSLLELRSALIQLNKSYEDEKNALDQLYENSRKYVKELIAKKETEGKK